MNASFRSKALLLALALLGGCAQYQWQKYGATQQDFNRESYECQVEAARLYPAAIVTQQLTSGYTTPSTTNCYGSGSAYGVGSTVYGSSSTNCTTTPGQTVAPVTYTADANTSNRNQATQACMVARGWQRVRITGNQRTQPTASGMSCAVDAECPAGNSCRSKRGGGTECRPIQLSN